MAYRGSRTQRSRIKGLSQAGNKAASDARLDNFIKSNQDLKNQSTIGSILNTVSDQPQLFGKNKESRRDFIERQIRENDGKINAAAQAMLDFYDDGRNDYSRGLNSLRTSSPAMMDAYARKFPVENFAMQAGPMAFGAMTGIPVAALQAGFDRTKQGAGLGLDSLRRAGEFLKKGIDVGASAIDKGMNFAKDRVYDVEDALYYNTPIGDLPETKDKIVDIFQDAIAKREDDNTFTPQNVPGPGGGVDFRDNFNSLNTSADTPESELLFKIPGMPGYMVQKNPDVGPTSAFTDVNKFVDLPNRFGTFVKFNEGGLASLNNRDYGMLMGASNFGF
tara:strand:- start:374 stop:1372 length:999 start_codon:yes stop_codon:yes gene_type:complete